MHGNTHAHHQGNSFTVIKKGDDKFYWQNLKTGYVSNRGWPTYGEAEEFAKEHFFAASKPKRVETPEQREARLTAFELDLKR